MKHLEVALKIETNQESRSLQSYSRVKSKSQLEMWSLDPDFIAEGPEGAKEKFTGLARDILFKKSESQKYLEEETFREVLSELQSLLPCLSCQLQRLMRVEETLQFLSEQFSGDMKNYLKQFQSLLDAKIRKIKRKGKKAQLMEFDRISQPRPMRKKKQEPLFINEEERQSHHKRKFRLKEETRLDSKSKKSFGTVGSGASNENESGSGKNFSGSDSKSGEANALAVLLAQRPNHNKNETGKENNKDKYDFSSLMHASIAVRHRSPLPTLPPSASKELEKTKETKATNQIEDDKDEAFIFHRPKAVRRQKL